MIASYHAVETVMSGNGRSITTHSLDDIQEFTVLEGGTAIISIQQPVQYDLSALGEWIRPPHGLIHEGIFQEIDMATGEVLFEWMDGWMAVFGSRRSGG